MNENKKLTVSSSPHIRAEADTQSVMLDVILAMLPALAVAIYVFGLRALAVVLVSVASCVFFEWGYRKLMKKTSSR
jgi:electron transport complex protein RnfD